MEPAQSSYSTELATVGREKSSSLPHQEEHVVRSVEEIQEDIRTLARTPDVPISGLSMTNKAYKTYSDVYRDIRALYGQLDAKEYEQDVVRFIKQLPRPEVIVPGTLGAFVFGCLYNINPRDNPFCSPSCLGSIPPGPDTTEYLSCDSQVWSYHGGRLNYVSGSGSEVKVYNRDSSLSSNEVAILKSNGASSVTVYSRRGDIVEERSLDSTQRLPTPTEAPRVQPPQQRDTAAQAVADARRVTFAQPVATTIAQPTPASLPVSADVPISGVVTPQPPQQEKNSTSSWGSMLWVIGILLVIVAIGVLAYYLFFRSSTPFKQNASPSQYVTTR